MENFDLLVRPLFTILDFVGALPVNNSFDLLKEDFVFSFDLDVTVLLDLFCFCITWRKLQVIIHESIHGSSRVSEHSSMFLVVLVVENGVKQFTWSLFLNRNCLDIS